MPDFDTVTQALQTLCAVPLNNTDENFQRILPRAYEYANNRIYREMEFLAIEVSTVGVSFTAGNPRVQLPTQFINPRYLNLITPGATSGDAGTRTPLERVSPEFMDFCFPNATTSGTSVPSKYAMYGDTSGGAFTAAGAFTIRVGFAPTTAYGLEIVGPVRPDPLSKVNPNTILSTRYPDLLIAACMVYLMGYQRDFGAQSDDPQKAMSWEKSYTNLRESTMVEVERQKSQSTGWSAITPSVLANQPRDRAGGGGGGGGGR